MLQEEIYVGDVKIPILKVNGDIFYPIAYVMDKVLLKTTGSKSLQKEYSKHIKKMNIDYGIHTGGVQEVNCISEEGLKLVLQNSRVGGLSVEQKKKMNLLLEYLHMDVISEDDRFIKRVSEDITNGYNEYIQDCIKYVIEEDPDIVWQKCSRCGNYYPYHVNFFRVNLHSGKDYPLYTFCRSCVGNHSSIKIIHQNKELNEIYSSFGFDLYKIYRDHLTLDIYNHWLNRTIQKLPKIINNENDKLIIIKDYFNKGMFNDYQDITSKVIYKVCKFNVVGKGFTQRIQKELFGVEFRNGIEYVDDIEDARRIFFNYLDKQNIKIDDNIYGLKYDQLFKDSHLYGFLRRNGNNILSLIMELFENKYPAYKFKTNGFKYWDKQENRIRALKYLIEEDMKISLEKVPLYITLTALRNNGGNIMYSTCKKYYKNLFEWVNEVYPDKFNEMDFDIHYIRNNFDSIEEAEIHDILKSKFKNVLYNPRNTDRTIIIDGMIPDWFIFTDKKCYILEYFGIAVDHKSYNKRTDEYIHKTNIKIDKYLKLDGYEKVFIYPDDLKSSFSGLEEKLKKIV